MGTSHHAIEFALAAVTVPLTLYFARNAATRHLRLLSGAACGLALLASPAAVSRSGIVSLVTALLVFMFAVNVRQIASLGNVGFLARLVATSSLSRTSRRRCGPRSSIRKRTKVFSAASWTTPGCRRRSTIVRCSASASADRRPASMGISTMNG